MGGRCWFPGGTIEGFALVDAGKKNGVIPLVSPFYLDGFFFCVFVLYISAYYLSTPSAAIISTRSFRFVLLVCYT